MESINDALIEVVKALGGSKQVGCMLWPEKMPDAAQRALLDCLNPERAARLSPEQMVLLLRKARQAGFHAAAEWLLADLGYARPVPLEPAEEMAALQRDFLQATQVLTSMAGRLEQMHAIINGPSLRGGAQ